MPLNPIFLFQSRWLFLKPKKRKQEEQEPEAEPEPKKKKKVKSTGAAALGMHKELMQVSKKVLYAFLHSWLVSTWKDEKEVEAWEGEEGWEGRVFMASSHHGF